PPPGVPGLETSLPLLLTAVQDRRLTLERLIELMALNPRRIYQLPAQPDTLIEVDPQTRYPITNEALHTRCGWSPFAGQTVSGWVRRVVLRGQTVFEATEPGAPGKILARPGYGRMIP
ncbi:MAG: dihydroorotase, partial [Chloroflexota bacterium]